MLLSESCKCVYRLHWDTLHAGVYRRITTKATCPEPVVTSSMRESINRNRGGGDRGKGSVGAKGTQKERETEREREKKNGEKE